MIHKFGPLSDEFLQKKETYFKNYKYTVLQSDKFRFDKMSETPTSGDQIYYWLEAFIYLPGELGSNVGPADTILTEMLESDWHVNGKKK